MCVRRPLYFNFLLLFVDHPYPIPRWWQCLPPKPNGRMAPPPRPAWSPPRPPPAWRTVGAARSTADTGSPCPVPRKTCPRIRSGNDDIRASVVRRSSARDGRSRTDAVRTTYPVINVAAVLAHPVALPVLLLLLGLLRFQYCMYKVILKVFLLIKEDISDLI